MDSATALVGLDADQRAAVTSTAKPLAIIASAGSGKTTVLTRRIAYRVLTGDADAAHVLALTFTRQAAGELRRRLRRFDLRSQIETGTFHAVALRLMRDRALARHEAEPQLAPDRTRLLRETLTHMKLAVPAHAAAADLDWCRARRIGPDEYYNASRAARRRSTVPASRFAEFATEYRQLKRRRGVVDFDDLLEGALAAMSDPAFGRIVQWRFRHFFVDEAQDLNPLQHAVLEAWRAGRPDLCLVGDPRQAIYGWNGADPTLLAQVERSYPGVTVIALTSNYRSSPQVVRAAAGVLAANGVTDDTLSQQPDGPAVSVVACADEADEALAITRVAADHARHHGASGVAVLARTNDQLGPISEALTQSGFAVDHGSRRSPLDRAVAEALRLQNRELLAAWAEDNSTHENPARRAVAEAADRYLSSAEAGGFRLWIEIHQPFDEFESATTDAITVTTFHAAKGREWPTVILAGVEAGLVPHASAVSDAQLAEEARLLYVAITRAAQHLVLTYPEQRRGALVQESPWLGAVRRSGRADRAAPMPAELRRRAPLADPIQPWKIWRSTIARRSGLSEQAVCSDATLHSMCEQPPTTAGELAQRLGVTPSAAARLPLPPGVEAWR